MTALSERLRIAMDGPPKVTQAALARACKIQPPSVNNWLSGKSQEIKGANLLAVARVLNVAPEWLASGKGSMRPYPGVSGNNSNTEQVSPSHSGGLDRATLHEALTLLFYDELHAGDYTPHARTDRLAELYRWVAADGGRLSKERNAAFVQQVSERHQELGESNAAAAVRRKGIPKTPGR